MSFGILLKHKVMIVVIRGVMTRLNRKYAKKLRPLFLAIKPGKRAQRRIPTNDGFILLPPIYLSLPHIYGRKNCHFGAEPHICGRT